MEAVPRDFRTSKYDAKEIKNDSTKLEIIEDNDREVLYNLYKRLRQTNDSLIQMFKIVDVEQFGSVNDKFDPNLHEASFQYSDNSKKNGSVGQVMKVGFKLKDRVLRPAEVGVVRNE